MSGASCLQFLADQQRSPVVWAGTLLHPENFCCSMEALHRLLDPATASTGSGKTWAEDPVQRNRQLHRALSAELANESRTHWQVHVPFDPLVSIGADDLLIEGFSADGLSWGCLFVDRNAISGEGETLPGTATMEAGGKLFHDLSQIPFHRPLRITVSPGADEGPSPGAGFREVVDLPHGWIARVVSLHAATTGPWRRVILGPDVISPLMQRLRKSVGRRTSQSLRIQLADGRPPQFTLEPDGLRTGDAVFPSVGQKKPTAVVDNCHRLLALQHLVPLASGFEIWLSGSGLSSWWVVQMGGIRLVWGLNSALGFEETFQQLWEFLREAPVEVHSSSPGVLSGIQHGGIVSMHQLTGAVSGDADSTRRIILGESAVGQAFVDPHSGDARFRPLLSRPITAEQILGGQSERIAAFQLDPSDVIIDGDPAGKIRYGGIRGRVEGQPCRVMVSRTGRILSGDCRCAWQQRGGGGMDPCRHLLALCSAIRRAAGMPSAD